MDARPRIDVHRLVDLTDELERWALRREKQLTDLDPRVARQIRTMLDELGRTLDWIRRGVDVPRQVVRDLINRADALVGEQEQSSVRAAPNARALSLAAANVPEDSGPVRLQALLQSETKVSRPGTEIAFLVPIRREESPLPSPAVRVPTAVIAIVPPPPALPRVDGWAQRTSDAPSAPAPEVEFTAVPPPVIDGKSLVPMRRSSPPRGPRKLRIGSIEIPAPPPSTPRPPSPPRGVMPLARVVLEQRLSRRGDVRGYVPTKRDMPASGRAQDAMQRRLAEAIDEDG